MKSRIKRLLSTLMALVVMIGLLQAVPRAASAGYPEITSHPQNRSITEGQNVSFSVAAVGTDVTYWWQYSFGGVTWNDFSEATTDYLGVAINGYSEATLTMSNVPLSLDGWRFRCLATGYGGLTTPSNAAILNVTALVVAPAITGPEDATLTVGYEETIIYGFYVTGIPLPTAIHVTGDDHITWLSGTNALCIAPGLAAGTYTVVLTTLNTAGTATFTFTLRVTGPLLMKTVRVSAQYGTLIAVDNGPLPYVSLATYNVTTTGIDNGATGAVLWYSDAAGTIAGVRPAGITASITAVYANTAIVTMMADDAAEQGTYYFRVTIDGILSSVATTTVTNVVYLPPSGMHNFVKTRTYTPGQFTDVDEDFWYGTNLSGVIATAYEYGLMQGTSETTFNPTGEVMLIEAIVMATRVHKIFHSGNSDFVQGDPWYQVYVDYAIENGMIAANDFDIESTPRGYIRPATRAEVAYIFSRSLPPQEFPVINTVTTPPDVNAGTPYYDSIIMMYRAGIFTGSDTLGTFRPDSTIIRAEAAAIIARVILPELRLSLSA